MSLEETLKRIEKRLEKIESEIREIRQQMVFDMMMDKASLISLPDHLRKTARGLIKIRQGTASDVSNFTGRARAVESGYLNQLEREGFAKSFRKGRRKFFMIERSSNSKLVHERI